MSPYNTSAVPKLGANQRKKVRQIRAARGIPAVVPAEQVQRHIQFLRDLGFSDPAIAVAAGVPQYTVWRIRAGRREKSRIDQASRILAVAHVPIPAQAGTTVSGLGVGRRLTALRALGYPQHDLAERLGCAQNRLAHLARQKHVAYATWRAVADLYEELSGTPGPDERVARFARKQGAVPPLGWEGLDIDHPDHSPAPDPEGGDDVLDEVLVARILRGGYKGAISKLERGAVIDYAIEHGWPGTRVAEVLGMHTDSASRAIANRRRKNAREAS